MVKLWEYKVKNDLCSIGEVPDRYYQQVLDLLVADGLYDEEGNKL